jgi:glyoxylase-like metal-dependent hydrolase (beta-lactamase superfamily II)
MSTLLKYTGTFTILRGEKATIHSYMAPPDGELTTSQIIETEHAVVVVDAQLLRPYAQEVRSYIDRLGKPINRIILSHPHVDHALGLEYFQDVPIYALAEVKGEWEATGEWNRQYKKNEVGDLAADVTVMPTHILSEGTEVIDGLTFVFKKVVNAESPFSLLIELPELKTVVAQDLVYNNVYLCVGIKNREGSYMFDGWIQNLEALQGQDYETVLAGHGEPTDSSIFPKLVDYIKVAKQTFESNPGPEKMKATMIEAFPTLRYPEMLDFSNTYLFFWKW